MTEITKGQLERLHRSGVALSKAWLTYAQPDLKAQWQELHQQSGTDLIKQDAIEAAKTDGDMSAKVAHALSSFSKLTNARRTLEHTLQANILSYVSSGHIHSFGYELPRSLSSAPVTIPKPAWAGTCDWEASTLSFRGLEFVDVRLTTNRIRNEILERGNVDKTPTNPAGRPGVGAAIKEAFNALHKTGQIDPQASQSSHYPKVRAWLELNKPDLPVPPASISDKTFYRYFSPLFRGL
ncbi:hypothetical protein [Pacificibacter marinus]|uniref:Uncharacterized protein n=1 Tax=Pacificibacter marinus TaxID=658057 RepID=A0A1Y5TRR1_9RHOB|nr:hypothetical protein [Pacificibacter marinus]SEL40683.1 hypothetical protein SAMN04488032_12611 [Pacificibacter marinus]SLN70639.1 hypothetical protein PAM7971_03789 [Pacificibacter marinus]